MSHFACPRCWRQSLISPRLFHETTPHWTTTTRPRSIVCLKKFRENATGYLPISCASQRRRPGHNSPSARDGVHKCWRLRYLQPFVRPLRRWMAPRTPGPQNPECPNIVPIVIATLPVEVAKRYDEIAAIRRRMLAFNGLRPFLD